MSFNAVHFFLSRGGKFGNVNPYIIRFPFSVETLHVERVVCIGDVRVDVQRLGHFRIVDSGNRVPNCTALRAGIDSVIGVYDTTYCNSLPHFR